jgi:hypothetical protein
MAIFNSYFDITRGYDNELYNTVSEDPALLMQRYFAPRKIEHVHALSTPENYKSNSRGLKFGEQNTSDLEVSVSVFKISWFSCVSTYK